MAAIELHRLHHLSFRDALILRAAFRPRLPNGWVGSVGA